MPKAAPSTRALAEITLNCSILTAPIRLYTGTVAAAGVERHEYISVPKLESEPVTDATGTVLLDRAGEPIHLQETIEVETEHEDGTKTVERKPVFVDHPVGRGPVDKNTGDLLSETQKANVQRKIETEYGPVYVEDHEIEKLFMLEPNVLTVQQFQPQHLFTQGNYVPRGLMFLEPQKNKTKDKRPMESSVKILNALLKGMRAEGVLAICELTNRGVPKPCILMPDGRLWLVYHTEATRQQREIPDAEVSEAELQMMGMLIQQKLTTDVADLEDKRSALIQAFAEEKAAAGDFGEADPDTYVVPEPQEPALDLTALLKASVELAKAENEAKAV